MLVERVRTAVFSVMAVGAALVVAVVFGLIWLLAGRRRELLLFSLLFLCVALLQTLQAFRSTLTLLSITLTLQSDLRVLHALLQRLDARLLWG
jgi:hypothetical protein